jgi:hypothetical protein
MISALTAAASRLLFLQTTLDESVVFVATLDRALAFGVATLDPVLVVGATLG